MEIEPNTFSPCVWQLASGPSTRTYSDVFLKCGVALIGPGDAGPWTAERGDEEFEGSFVRRFANEVRRGDIFLLRTGIATIVAVGIVASDYVYLNQFDDVNGWDLQHARRVRWCRLPQDHTFPNQPFDANLWGGCPLPRMRCSRVRSNKILDYAKRFLHSPPTHWHTGPLPELPVEEPLLEEVPSALQGVVAEVHDLVPLLWDRQAFGEHPSEDELIAHLVVPFLRVLGWHPERIGVKWRRIDVGLFRALPRTPDNCHIVIEVKRLGAGVEGALKQAKRYVGALGLARDIVVTDGVRYRMYSCRNDFEPIAYANLARLKRSALGLFDRLKRP